MMAETAESLGDLLRNLRSAQKVSQEEAAAEAGVARSTLIRWERSAHLPRLPELMAVLDVYGASPAQRAQALTLISAPRAAQHLLETHILRPEEHEDWLFTPGMGDLLRALRQRRGWTQDQVAAQMGIRSNSLSRWEGGEDIPSRERLDQLLTLLDAYPQERSALTRARLQPFHVNDAADTSPDAMVHRIFELAHGTYDKNGEALKDLEYLQLEARLAQAAFRRPALRPVLLRAYSHHAHWLVNNRRYREGERYAERVLEAMRSEAFPERDWLRAAIVASHAAVYSGRCPRPERGVEMLQRWLPLASLPQFKAWIQGDLALYHKQMGQIEVALDHTVRACQIARHNDNPMELRLRRVDRAEVLLGSGRPHDAMHALELLPLEKADHPGERVREALLWAGGLLLVGEKPDGQSWLERAYLDIEKYHLDTSAADALARQF